MSFWIPGMAYLPHRRLRYLYRPLILLVFVWTTDTVVSGRERICQRAVAEMESVVGILLLELNLWIARHPSSSTLPIEC